MKWLTMLPFIPAKNDAAPLNITCPAAEQTLCMGRYNYFNIFIYMYEKRHTIFCTYYIGKQLIENAQPSLCTKRVCL